MKFDFTVGMTQYELIAIIMSAIALSIPLIKYLWNKFVVKPKLTYHPFDQVTFYYNQSGSYLQFGFVLRCEKASAIVNDISVCITRKNNSDRLCLDWSSFISIYNQRVGDNRIIANEVARPIYITKDNLHPLLIQFYITDNDTINKLRRIHTDMRSELSKYPQEFGDGKMEEAIILMRDSEKYKKYYPQLEEELFWKKGDYTLEITTTYNDSKKFVGMFDFSISHEEANNIKNNIDESLVCDLKNKVYNQSNFYVVYKDFKNIRMGK